MLRYPEISPVIFEIGPLAMRWYGLMYAVSFFLLITLMRRESRTGFLPLSEKMVERLFICLVIGILAGARLFYQIFYAPGPLFERPLESIAIWHGGLSFHGGFTGILVASFIVARQAGVAWSAVLDTLTLVGPIGIFLGRIGNFINGELYGRPTDLPWAMIFPSDPLHLPRHPSQLYESLLEGLVTGLFLWALKGRVKRHGIIAACFVLCYSIFRTSVEFVREPDPQLGLVFGPFTMGQLLSMALFIPGLGFLLHSLKKGPLIQASDRENDHAAG